MTDPQSFVHPFADLLGFSVSSRAEGRCSIELDIAPKHFNPHGIVHGGVLYSVADTGMGGALTSLLTDDEICTTVEIKIVYFRPATAGRLLCDTEVVNRGRRTAALESTLSVDDRMLARAYGTFMILPRP
ncbi:MAG: PaaI family thioesterase [Gammaproteobacteria bacterium]|nr:PaaI family thioesterase [Gammaproteobacteria bacterium]